MSYMYEHVVCRRLFPRMDICVSYVSEHVLLWIKFAGEKKDAFLISSAAVAVAIAINKKYTAIATAAVIDLLLLLLYPNLNLNPVRVWDC